MWNEARRQRFAALRKRAKQGALTPEERVELDGLYHEIEEMEAAYLSPATERKRQEAENLHAINEALREVTRRKEERLAQMKAS
jgi:hypothetical protein